MYGLDLFSGIGGITRALAEYVQPVAYCENDKYAQSVLLSRMASRELPMAPIWGDVRTLTVEDLPYGIDIIYGGFPCQDISCAGRGAGMGGERSGLFFEIVRLAEEIKPQFIFLENVPAIRTRGSSVVLEELSTLRYDCRWGMLSAKDVGANHRRQRWWLLAHAMPAEQRRDEREGQTEKDVMANAARKNRRREVGAWESTGSSEVADSDNTGSRVRRKKSGRRTESERVAGWWSVEPNVGRVAHGVPFRVDRLRGLCNAVVPAQAREAFERLMGIK